VIKLQSCPTQHWCCQASIFWRDGEGKGLQISVEQLF